MMSLLAACSRKPAHSLMNASRSPLSIFLRQSSLPLGVRQREREARTTLCANVKVVVFFPADKCWRGRLFGVTSLRTAYVLI